MFDASAKPIGLIGAAIDRQMGLGQVLDAAERRKLPRAA
jgi:hypothetical protein